MDRIKLYNDFIAIRNSYDDSTQHEKIVCDKFGVKVANISHEEQTECFTFDTIIDVMNLMRNNEIHLREPLPVYYTQRVINATFSDNPNMNFKLKV